MATKKKKSNTYSELPEDIIHHIFSFSTRKEAAKTSLLCKSWRQAWISYPVLNFNEKEFFPGGDVMNSSKVIAKFMSRIVDDSMKTFVSNSNACGGRNKPVMQKFHLILFGRTPIKYTLVRKWVDMALKSRVQDLNLHSNCNGFRIPKSLFSTKSLRSLALMGPELRLPILNMSDVDLCSLRSLSIDTHSIDDHSLRSILLSCPLLEYLHLDCINIGTITIPDFPNLKILKVGRFKTVRFNTLPSIESFSMWNHSWNFSIDTKDAGLYHVRSLSIVSCFNYHYSLPSILSKFPFLENLNLDNYPCNTKIKISDCRNLKMLKVRAFKEVRISRLPCLKSLCITMSSYYDGEMYLSIDSAQKLRYLTLVKDGGKSDTRFYKYNSEFPSPFSFDLISLSSTSKAFVLRTHPMDDTSKSAVRYWILHFASSEFHRHGKLRQCLLSMSQKCSTLTLSIIENEWNKNESLHLSGPACAVKELNLNVRADSSRYLTILSDLFLICHPLFLCLWAAEEDKDFIKLMCEGFIGQGDGEYLQQQLIDVKIKGITGRKRSEDYGPMELNGLIHLLPSLKEYHKICFRLRWIV